MSGFSPTKNDLLMIESLIIDLKDKKSKITNVKTGIQNQLSVLKAKYSTVDLNSDEFHKIKIERGNLKGHVSSLENQTKSINEELNAKTKMKLEIEFYLKNNKSLEGRADLDKIILKVNLLKKKYQQFAKDRTRISSLRVIASEFIDELENIIK